MFSRIKQLLLLTESDLNSPSVTILQQSALRIILSSGLLLVLGIVLHSSWQAFQQGAWYIIVITFGFYLLLAAAFYLSTRQLGISRVIMLFAVFGAGLCMQLFIDDFELSKLGAIFVYVAPLIALLFFNRAVTFWVMAANFIPFLFLLNIDAPIKLFDFSITLPATHTYLHSLLFLFINLCIPLAIMRMISTFKRNANALKALNNTISESNQLYQEIFNHHSNATLLVASKGRILKANAKAKQLLQLENIEQHRLTALLHTTATNSPMFWLGHDMHCQLSSEPGIHLLLNHITTTAQEHHLIQLDDVTPLKLIHEKLTASKQQNLLWRNYDRLTSLPNMTFFLHLMRKVQQENTQSGVMLIVRLCHVKAFNQQYGYAAGDELLSKFAGQFRESLPDGTILSRLRGVKFVLWHPLREHSISVSDEVSRLRQLLPAKLTLSHGDIMPAYEIGVSTAKIADASTELLLEQCESALELANTYHQPVAYFRQDSLHERNVELQLLADLKIALAQKELTLWLQPKVTSEGTIQSFEALLRWQRSSGEYVPPDKIVALAEQYGLIGQLSLYVFNAALNVIAQFRQQQLFYPIAINLSGSDVITSNFYNALVDLATHRPQLLKYLTLELTENSIVSHQQPLFDKLAVLQKLGFSIALDDFGTGQASLSMLTKLPLDTMKLDKSFLRDIPHNKMQVQLVQTVIQLAKALNLHLVLEGVETDVQRRFMAQLGCKLMQGYFFSKPQPAQHWLDTLKQQPAIS